MRNDLMALTDEDLAMLTNRGTLKRAQREIEEGTLQCDFEEADGGELLFRWSDDVRCRILAEKTLQESLCDCPSTTLCRHLIRSVLFYRKSTKTNFVEESIAAETAWSPGGISDDQLSARFKASRLAAAKKAFEAGIVVDLVRSPKPTARFRQESCTVRYLVPNDLRYTVCDCRENTPCRHALLGVWAFRLLDDSKTSGIVETHRTELPVPHELLDRLEEWLKAWVLHGLAHLSERDLAVLRKLETELRVDNLFFPAEIVGELLEEFHRYRRHDARFEPERLHRLLAELLIRMDAIRQGPIDIPQLFLRGTKINNETETGVSKLVGLGSKVRCTRKHTLLSLYFQEADTGSVLRLDRQFENPADGSDEPKTFSQLASTVVLGVSMRSLAESHLMLSAGKRFSGGRISLGRSRSTVTPQAFQWEKLRSPLLVENFAEVQAILSALPPMSLRFRSSSEDFFVVPLAGIHNVHFDPSKQLIVADMIDPSGGSALLRHPYHGRGAPGFEAFFETLADREAHPRFIAGRFRTTTKGLQVDPIGFVFEKPGRPRQIVQPWIGLSEAGKPKDDHLHTEMHAETNSSRLPDDSFVGHLSLLLEESLLTGWNVVDSKTSRRWRTLYDQAMQSGFRRVADELHGIVDRLRHSDEQLHFNAASIIVPLLRLHVWQRLFDDYGVRR